MKQQAKLLFSLSSPLKATLALLLSTSGLTLLISYLLPDHLVTSLLVGNFQDDAVTLSLFILILLVLFTWLMNYGYRNWSLSTAREEITPLSALLNGFGIANKVIFLNILKFACIYFWCVALFFVASLMTSPLVLLLSNLNASAFLSSALILVISFCVSIAVWLHIRYCFASFILADYPDKGAYHAIYRGVQLQSAHFIPLLKFHLSFWHWILLFALVSGAYEVLFYETVLGTPILSSDYKPVCDLIYTLVNWGITLKFLPLYTVSLGLFYKDVVPKDLSVFDPPSLL